MFEIKQGYPPAASYKGINCIGKGNCKTTRQALRKLVRVSKSLTRPFAKAAGKGIAQGRALQTGLAIGRCQGPGQAGVCKAAAASEIPQAAAVAQWFWRREGGRRHPLQAFAGVKTQGQGGGGDYVAGPIEGADAEGVALIAVAALLWDFQLVWAQQGTGAGIGPTFIRAAVDQFAYKQQLGWWIFTPAVGELAAAVEEEAAQPIDRGGLCGANGDGDAIHRGSDQRAAADARGAYQGCELALETTACKLLEEAWVAASGNARSRLDGDRIGVDVCVVVAAGLGVGGAAAHRIHNGLGLCSHHQAVAADANAVVRLCHSAWQKIHRIRPEHRTIGPVEAHRRIHVGVVVRAAFPGDHQGRHVLAHLAVAYHLPHREGHIAAAGGIADRRCIGPALPQLIPAG